MKKLTSKEELFCREYVITKNAHRSAVSAGYSEKTARNIASQNLTKIHIINRIKELQAPVLKKYEVTTENIIKELAKIGFSSEDDLEGFSKLELKDKLKALEMLARTTGAFNKDESNKNVINVTMGKK